MGMEREGGFVVYVGNAAFGLVTLGQNAQRSKKAVGPYVLITLHLAVSIDVVL
jgi:hypothetical protein